jgi:hypothetical protein
MPSRELWRSSSIVTHGDVRLPFCSRFRIAPADQLALRAYFGRYRGEIRLHTESDLEVSLRWCTDQDLDPAGLSVVVDFYCVCVINPIAAPPLSRPNTSADRRCRRCRPFSTLAISSSRP